MSTKQPEALRLADMADVTDRSTNWQEWKREAAALLRTQHALLERAKVWIEDASQRLQVTRAPSDVARIDAAIELADAITQHLEPK